MTFWLAIVAAATAVRDVATKAALRVRAYEDGDLRGPEEWCESHRRLLLSAFLLNIFERLKESGNLWSATIAGRFNKRWLSASKYCSEKQMHILQATTLIRIYASSTPEWDDDRHRAVRAGSFHSTCTRKNYIRSLTPMETPSFKKTTNSPP
jgi:hypothetical protein